MRFQMTTIYFSAFLVLLLVTLELQGPWINSEILRCVIPVVSERLIVR